MNLDLSDLQEQRLRKANELRELGFDPYTPRSSRTHTTAEALTRFAELEANAGEAVEDTRAITVAGRVVGQRHMGKTVFAHLRDGHGQIQIYLRKDEVGEEAFERFSQADRSQRLRRSDRDASSARKPARSRSASATITSSPRRSIPRPKSGTGLQDVEIRFRQRYADLIANAEVRRMFEVRARAISAIRRYLDSLGYLEVETPTLQPLYGGAAARPFTTYHNALDQTFYLRIADELYLKRLIVGGYERVYEICKDFRNEGVDRNHSPEFTMLEFYEAFADYRTIMDRVEGLFVARRHRGLRRASPHLPAGTRSISRRPGRASRCGRRSEQIRYRLPRLIRISRGSLAAARAAGADIETGTVWPRIVDELLKQFVRPNLIQPTILVDYPVALSPLAKRKPDDPTHVERFQPYIGGTGTR